MSVSSREAVAWLRIVAEGGGGGVRAALFETSAGGEPLGFGFVRGAGAGGAPAALAGLVWRASAARPALLLGLAGEVPPGALDGLNPGVPVCRVRAPLPPDDPPAPDTPAGAILAEIMERDDPFEPLERAGRGLAEAFSDPRVRALAGVPGLRTVVTLPPRPDGGGRLETRDALSPPGDGPGRGLAARLWAVLAAPRTAPPPRAPDETLEWPGDLMPFQRDGVRALVGMDRLLLSDDMGLGKTVQAVAALRILKARGEIGSCLVVAPAGLLDQWRREIARWAPDLSAIVVRGPADDRAWQWKVRRNVTLASYDVLRSDSGILSRLRAPEAKWDAVVLDEAQRIKNRNDTSEAAKSVPRARSWALTGTPVENDEEELASIMEFVDHDDGAPRKRYRPGAELRRRHRELQLRRKKGDVLVDLPPKLETRLPIRLHRDQRESYDKAEREGVVYLKSLGSEVRIAHVLELITRLKQICNADPRTGASSKLDDISERLRALTAQGHKALVFSQYTSGAAGVAAAARRLRAFDPLVLTGAVPPEERPALIDRFRNAPAHKVLIVSLRAGGVGLNLQEASYVFHLDRWWNPAVERQAEDRTHRMGQTVKVNVVKYTCTETIEERIDGILERKQALFDRLVDDVSMDLSARMSRGELLGLFGL